MTISRKLLRSGVVAVYGMLRRHTDSPKEASRMISAPLRRGGVAPGLGGIVLMLGGAAPEKPSVRGQSPVGVGEYLVAIGGCNDCHTDG